MLKLHNFVAIQDIYMCDTEMAHLHKTARAKILDNLHLIIKC